MNLYKHSIPMKAIINTVNILYACIDMPFITIYQASQLVLDLVHQLSMIQRTSR